MKPIFTIHAGEYLAGSYIESSLRDNNGEKVNLWIPSKDTGIDLLITDKSNKFTTSLQIKFSKDFLITHGRKEYQKHLLSHGWWTLDRNKIIESKADYWVFVLHTFNSKNMQYIILSPTELYRRLNSIHPNSKRLQTYLWVSKNQKCWETRGLKKDETDDLVLNNGTTATNRDFSRFLNNWSVLYEDWSSASKA